MMSFKLNISQKCPSFVEVALTRVKLKINKSIFDVFKKHMTSQWRNAVIVMLDKKTFSATLKTLIPTKFQ